MAAGGRLLCTVRLRNAEHITQRWNGSLEVQLRALRQVRIFLEVLDLEESGAALDLCLHEDNYRFVFNTHLSLDNSRRCDLEVAAVEEVLTEALSHDGAGLHHSSLDSKECQERTGCLE